MQFVLLCPPFYAICPPFQEAPSGNPRLHYLIKNVFENSYEIGNFNSKFENEKLKYFHLILFIYLFNQKNTPHIRQRSLVNRGS
jgi:hypothetical protein